MMSTPEGLSAAGLEFAPRLLALQESPPAPLPRLVLWLAAILVAILVVWACFGRLDIVASAEGKLVPKTYLKILQPADAGIVQDILVHEGEHVQAAQVLLRMDTHEAQADERTVQAELAAKSLRLRRIDAELSNRPMKREASDPGDLFQQVEMQCENNRRTHGDEVSHAQETVRMAQQDYQSNLSVLAKLRAVVPMLKQEADSYADLGKDGYVPRSAQQEKQRQYLEMLHDLTAQESTVQGRLAAVAQASRQLDEVTSKYRSDLQNERVETEGDYLRLRQEQLKQSHKSDLLELRAPVAGIVKDLATHTKGTVVSPGTVLLSIVPEDEPLVAEVLVRNDDVGFVYPNQKVRLKLAAYPFQKYGLLDGKVTRVSPDAMADGAGTSRPQEAPDADARAGEAGSSGYKVLVALRRQTLDAQGSRLKLVPGMQVVAEINQGRRTVIEYLLSPIVGTIHDSARER